MPRSNAVRNLKNRSQNGIIQTLILHWMDAWQFLKWLYLGFERANQRWTYLDLEPSLGSRMMLLLTILQNKQIPAVNINNRLFEVRFDSQHINLILCYRVMNKVGCVFLVVIRSEFRMGQWRRSSRRRIPLLRDIIWNLAIFVWNFSYSHRDGFQWFTKIWFIQFVIIRIEWW